MSAKWTSSWSKTTSKSVTIQLRLNLAVTQWNIILMHEKFSPCHFPNTSCPFSTITVNIKMVQKPIFHLHGNFHPFSHRKTHTSENRLHFLITDEFLSHRWLSTNPFSVCVCVCVALFFLRFFALMHTCREKKQICHIAITHVRR